jgi:hypothetical protein
VPARKFENAILLILSAVILGGLVATFTQYLQMHPEQVERMLENQRQAELMLP